ncbi:MAG: Ig-like domain-containing protein [Bacilli bacterium]
MKKNFLILCSLLLCTPMLNSCNQTTQETLLIKGNNQVGINEYIDLSAYLNDELTDNVIWSSSDPSIATVSSIGMVKGLKVGTVIISCVLSNNKNVSNTFEVSVHESYSLSNVMGKFIKDKVAYKTSVNNTIKINNQNIDIKFEEKYYTDSYLFISSSMDYESSFGYGEENDTTIVYHYDYNNEITNAEFLRTEVYNYRSLTYDLQDLSINDFANYNLNDNNEYEILENNTKTTFISFINQNFNTTNDKTSAYQSLSNGLTSLKIKVQDENNFSAIYDFSSSIVTMNFSLINEENTLLNNYLSKNSIGKPTVESDILKIKDLSRNHNYIRDLGRYIDTVDGKKIEINMGTCYYTENYIYYDFTDEYIEYYNAHPELQINNANKTLFDFGYINISSKTTKSDGVYYFEYKSIDGEMKLMVSNDKYREDNNFTNYTKYYEFIENLTWIMDYTDDKLFTYEKTNTNTFDESYNEYVSNSLDCADITYYLFQDYITAFDATPLGLFLAYKNADEEKDCIVYVGAYLYIKGAGVFDYQNYSYSGFNSSNVKLIDDYLLNLK